MAKKYTKPEEIFQEFITDYQNIFKEEIISIILYGSGARKDFTPGKSDINFLIVLTENGIKQLNKAEENVKKWWKHKVSIPLFLTESYIKSSLDTFPIEFFNMKLHYKVVWGKDIFKEIEIKPEDLRRQCEREIKGKLLHLRQSYFHFNLDKKQIYTLIPTSLRTFMAFFPSILQLKGEQIPETRKEMLDRIVTAFNLDKDVFNSLWNITSGKSKVDRKNIKELFLKYIEEIRKLANAVDQWEK